MLRLRTSIGIAISIIGVLLALAWLFLTRPTAQQESWNVIVITVDTLRADHLGVYGYARPTSPNLDRFAKESVVFQHARAHTPITLPSLSTLMSSHYPRDTRALNNEHVLPQEVVTLAEILQAHGYRTGAVVGGVAAARDSGLDQGFDEYDDHWQPTEYERDAAANTRAAIDWLQRHHREKFFFWVHYMDPHSPYRPPVPYDSMFIDPHAGPGRILSVSGGQYEGTGGIPSYSVLGDHRELNYYVSQYDGEIRYCDFWLGELFRAIEGLGLLERTLIVFTSDHGEGLGEHNYYFQHADYLYEELLRVPLIVRFPGQAESGRRIDRLVGHIEVLPAILHFLSIESSVSFEGTGSLIEGDEAPLYAETFAADGKRAIFFQGFKLIQSRKEDYEAYDLREDDGETHNLMDSNSPVAVLKEIMPLKARLVDMASEDKLQLGPPLLRPQIRILEEKLRSLGYVQ